MNDRASFDISSDWHGSTAMVRSASVRAGHRWAS